VLPAGAPAGSPLGNEAGNLITFSCGENLQFNAGLFNVTEDVVTAPITIVRGSPGAGTVTVDFATSDGTANQVGDYTAIFSTVTFGPGETSKVINVLITEDAYVEGNEVINLTLSNATGGASVGGQSTATLTILNDDLAPTSVNPIDDPSTFVNQHYHDFLNRQGDAPGVAFWTSEITSCGVNPACIEIKRINVSAAFFLSIEFQESGFYAIRAQRAAFGKRSDNPSTRLPYLQFLKDSQQIGRGVFIPGGEALLATSQQTYAEQIASSPAFIASYPLSMTASELVDALFAIAGVAPTPAERSAAITAFGGGGATGRGAALRSVAKSNSLSNAEFNAAFVLMQYYGYLRRNPTDPPDNNDVGYQFWLTKLNAFGGNFINAELVKAFLSSTEYRQRFGTP
jgi:Calx-beta domain